MDALFRKSDRLLANTRTDIIRDKMGDIHWNAQPAVFRQEEDR